MSIINLTPNANFSNVLDDLDSGFLGIGTIGPQNLAAFCEFGNDFEIDCEECKYFKSSGHCSLIDQAEPLSELLQKIKPELFL